MRPTRPYYASRNRDNICSVTNCAREVERRLARASRGSLLSPHRECFRPHRRRRPRYAADARSRRTVPRTAHPTRRLPYCPRQGRVPTTRRRGARRTATGLDCVALRNLARLPALLHRRRVYVLSTRGAAPPGLDTLASAQLVERRVSVVEDSRIFSVMNTTDPIGFKV